jgi:hypothetical protein
MPRKRPNLPKMERRNNSNFPQRKELIPQEKQDLLDVKKLLEKETNISFVTEIYEKVKSMKSKGGYIKNLTIDWERVKPYELDMIELTPSKEYVVRKVAEVPGLLEKCTRDVVKIKSVKLNEIKIETFSPYFFQSSGASRNNGLKGNWMPSGQIPLQYELGKLRYSKLEDKILEKVNEMDSSGLTYNVDDYKRDFSEFTFEFPNWNTLMASIIENGRFISIINAIISHELQSLIKKQAEAVAEGKKKKLSGKGAKKGSKKSKAKGKGSKKSSKSKKK